MALKITDDCTNCDACVPVCVNEAISEGRAIYVIDPEKCTECVDTDMDPRCASVCPVDCIVPDPWLQESREDLRAKHHQLHAVMA